MSTTSVKTPRAALFFSGLLAIALTLTACATPEIKKDVHAFSESVNTTTTNTSAAFQMVEDTHYQAKVAQLVADYDKNGFRPDAIGSFLPPEELNVRLQALQALDVYAGQLADIMSDKKLEEFDSETKSFGQGLLKLRENEAVKKFAPNETEFKAFTTAVDALGHWLIDYKRDRGLKGIVADMDGPVHDICRLLSADIGAPPDSSGKGGHGLRSQLRLEYNTLLMAQDSYILHNKEKFDPGTKRKEIERLPELVREREAADATLAATQTAINRLAQTHAELAKSFDAPTPKLKQLIRELGDEGEQIGQFYKSIGK